MKKIAFGKEFGAIRVNLREKTKHMAAEERAAFANAKAAPICEKHGREMIDRFGGRKSGQSRKKSG